VVLSHTALREELLPNSRDKLTNPRRSAASESKGATDRTRKKHGLRTGANAENRAECRNSVLSVVSRADGRFTSFLFIRAYPRNPRSDLFLITGDNRDSRFASVFSVCCCS